MLNTVFIVFILISLLVNILNPAAVQAAGAPCETPAQVIEQAKLATVGILQANIAQTKEQGYEVPIKVRGSGIHLGEGIILTARHAVERSEGGKVVVPG